MASKDDKIFGPDGTSESRADDSTSGQSVKAGVTARKVAPVKKAAAKRAPRKATKKASTPKKVSTQVAEPTTPDEPNTPDEPTTPAEPSTPAEVPAEVPATRTRKIAKRAPRKTAKKAVPPAFGLEPEPVDPALELEPVPLPADEPMAEPMDEDKAEPVSEPVTAPPVQTFGLFFQPPAPTEAPRRRRATAPAAAPAPEQAPTSHAQPQPAPAKGEAPHRDEDTQDSAKPVEESDDSGADDAPRRRRRGGKGRRGRGTGDGGGEESPSSTEATTGASTGTSKGASADDSSTESTPSDQPSADDSESAEGDSHRRTRRRRRSSAGEGDDQQPSSSASTTTRVRAPRPPKDEVASVKGSTRLEAKKQRRREGREAGRRRTVITEAEFLARRESVERVMVVRHQQDRTQIAVLEDGVLVEHYVSDESNASMAGNVHLGRIQNVLPSMEAAFVDIGKGRNAVLYAGEVNWDAAGLDNRAKRIENALSSGQSVLVQVTKDPIGHKGARLTSQVSLPGRYLVYVPDGNMMGISRKLPDNERARLKKILREVVPENAGVIVRTAAEGATEDELRADVTRLTAVWADIQAKSKKASAPALLHGESDLTVRVIRDVFNEDFAKLVVSGEPAWETVNDYVSTVAPDLAGRVQKWTGEKDLFTNYRVDEQIAKAMDRKVWLPSGGTLVIDRTEAMTVVDVNTGKFVGSGGNLEETVTKNNIEAAEEVVRQLRLRDIGGIIVIDFIDMVLESNRDLVVRRLLECLGRDRTKHQVAEVTSLGLVQMTRKRVGAGLIEVFSETCEHCNGRGIIVSSDPIDRPSGSDGSSGGGNNGGGSGGGGSSSGGGGDSGSGRGPRGRRGRSSVREANVTVAPAPELRGTTSGPTPAQIAAAAHAAAVQATTRDQASRLGALGEEAAQVDALGDDVSRVGTSADPVSQADTSGELTSREAADLPSGERVVELPSQASAELAAPVRSRRRSPRSAKSPAVTPAAVPVAEPVVAEPVVVEPEVAEPAVSEATGDRPAGAPLEAVAQVKSRRRSPRSSKSPVVTPAAVPLAENPVVGEPAVERAFEPPTTPAESAPSAAGAPTAGSAPVADAPEVPPTAPAVRARRKRPRVVAPAGPPRGADNPPEAGGEFGS